MKTQNIPNVVNGRLYAWRGNVVRAGRKTNNGLRHVRIHKLMHGFVPDCELEIINPTAVKQYLALANI